MSAIEILAVVAIVAFVIGRQFMGEPLRGKRLILLPAILTVVGFVDLSGKGSHPTATDVGCIAVSAVVAAAIGAGQGSVMHLESRNGALWGRMPLRGLWLWLALIASRVGMMVVAHGLDAKVAASFTPMLFLLGINRLAQAAVVTPRSLASGIPFAPEKDGRVFLAEHLEKLPAFPRQDTAPGTTWDAAQHTAQHAAPGTARHTAQGTAQYAARGTAQHTGQDAARQDVTEIPGVDWNGMYARWQDSSGQFSGARRPRARSRSRR